uniref:Uncharacterized protein n=1 Tax=Rhizophora mucronata TaxID=61149 RepID=A0A2P2PSY1_RHIMU
MPLHIKTNHHTTMIEVCTICIFSALNLL